MDNLDNAKHILINTCDILPCPLQDTTCDKKSENFLTLLKSKFYLVSKTNYESCTYYIYRSTN